jgi:hypothetical protein
MTPRRWVLTYKLHIHYQGSDGLARKAPPLGSLAAPQYLFNDALASSHIHARHLLLTERAARDLPVLLRMPTSEPFCRSVSVPEMGGDNAEKYEGLEAGFRLHVSATYAAVKVRPLARRTSLARLSCTPCRQRGHDNGI